MQTPLFSVIKDSEGDILLLWDFIAYGLNHEELSSKQEAQEKMRQD